MNFNLKNKNVIVSASSKGIGFSAVKLFLEEGANVTMLSSNRKNLDIAVNKLSNYQDRVHTIICDINNYDDIKKAVKSAEDKFGSTDVLVNNCGGPKPGYFDQLNEDDWLNGYYQVLMSAVRFTREVLPGMKKKNNGRIINVTSLSVKQPVDNLLLSNTFRSALTAFTKSLSNDISKYNITLNNVAPGYTHTERLDELAEIRAESSGKSKDEIFSEMASGIPLKRIGAPEEIASMIVFLASEQGGYVNGTTIQVDGGVIKSTY
ncbi:MAG: short-chain dehydrogenase [Melioribacteraceae bacterium]|nr:MAG: short-chain dehydrogenase [Melioribacteraceae bacterium]